MLGIEAGLQRGIELAAGDHVGVDALGLEDPVNKLGAQGLAGIGHLILLTEVAGHGLGKGAAVLADLLFAHHIDGGAVLLGHLHQIHAVQVQMTVVLDGEMVAVVVVHVNSPLLLFGYQLLIGRIPCLFRRKRG